MEEQTETRSDDQIPIDESESYPVTSDVEADMMHNLILPNCHLVRLINQLQFPIDTLVGYVNLPNINLP